MALCGRSHPAESHVGGMENSDHPQSRHTMISGDGVMGGWLSVRGLLRYSRTSAGIRESALDWHFGQAIGDILNRDALHFCTPCAIFAENIKQL